MMILLLEKLKKLILQFKQSPRLIASGKPAHFRVVEKTDVVGLRSSQCRLKNRVFRADALTEFTNLITRFKHENLFCGSTFWQRSNL